MNKVLNMVYSLNSNALFCSIFGVLIIMSTTIMLSSCISNAENKMIRETERLLNIELSEQVEDLQIEEIPANSALTRPETAFTTYIRARMLEEVYLDLVEQLELDFRGEGDDNEYTIYLLTQLYPRETTPIWWTPDPIPNEYSSAGGLKSAQTRSWIISTYDGEFAFFKLYEEGILD